MQFQQPKLHHYLQHPKGQLAIKSIRIGKVEFHDIFVQDRAGALHLQDLVQATYDHSEKLRRLRRNGTRYPEPLPLATPARLLSEEVDDFLKDKERQNLRTTTIDAYRRTLAILQRVAGNTSVSRIDHTSIYAMWDLLRWAPEDFMTNPKLQGLPVQALITQGQRQGRPQPANATLELHRRFLASFFNTLVKARAVPHSPMDAFKPARDDLLTDQEAPERLLSEEEVQKIFNPETFVPWAKKYPHRWWCPLIALYTGARINEIAQLKVSDIIQDQGVWCFSVQKTVDEDLAQSTGKRTRQSLKGKSAIRKVPIHESLLQAERTGLW